MARRPPENLVELGHVAGAYGVRGWVKVQSGSAALAACASWWVDGTERAVEATKPHSGLLLAKLAGIENREQAQALKGKMVAVPRERLPQQGEGRFYTADLVGLEVVNVESASLGRVTGLFSNGAHDVMRIGAGKDERLVPFVPAVVRKVDLAAGRIEVEWGSDW